MVKIEVLNYIIFYTSNMDIKVELSVKRKSDLDALLAFIKSTPTKVVSIVHPEEKKIDLTFNIYNYIPNGEFKAFCGPERLNSKGYISLNSAYSYIMFHVTRHNLLLHDSYSIKLDDELKYALNTDMPSISVYELHTFLKNLFKKV